MVRSDISILQTVLDTVEESSLYYDSSNWEAIKRQMIVNGGTAMLQTIDGYGFLLSSRGVLYAAQSYRDGHRFLRHELRQNRRGTLRALRRTRQRRLSFRLAVGRPDYCGNALKREKIRYAHVYRRGNKSGVFRRLELRLYGGCNTQSLHSQPRRHGERHSDFNEKGGVRRSVRGILFRARKHQSAQRNGGSSRT